MFLIIIRYRWVIVMGFMKGLMLKLVSKYRGSHYIAEMEAHAISDACNMFHAKSSRFSSIIWSYSWLRYSFMFM